MLKQYFVRNFLTVFVLAGSLLIVNTANAQFYFGGKAGPTYTTVNGDFPGNNYKLGFSSGATVGVAFGDYDQFNIQADLLLTTKGLNQTFTEVSSLRQGNILTETTLEYDNDLNLTYFEAPLTFKYSLSLGGGAFPYHGENGPVNIDLMAGPYFGMLMNATASFNTRQETRVAFYNDEGEVEDENTSSSEIEGGKFRLENRGRHGLSPYGSLDTFSDVDIPSTLDGNLNQMDIGISTGIGISFELDENHTLGLEGRYTVGLVTIDDTFFNNYEVEPEVNNQEVTYNVNANQADLTNSAFVGYVTWTYQISPEPF